MRIKEVIVVEGRYDKNTVKQAVDCTVIETSGFGIFSNKEKIALLKRLAEKQGLIILTDSDNAGFLIRGHLKGMLDTNIKNAYIPDIPGKEKRKRNPSKQGLLGVEGMDKEIIIAALRRAGATFENEGESQTASVKPMTKADMFALGLTGTPDSATRRKVLLKELNLPAGLTPNGFLEVMNALYSQDELYELCKRLFD